MPKAFGALRPAPGAHYLMGFIWTHAALSGKSLDLICQKAGVAYSTVKRAFRGEGHMGLDNLEALLNELGYTLKPTPLPEPKDRPATPDRIPTANGKCEYNPATAKKAHAP